MQMVVTQSVIKEHPEQIFSMGWCYLDTFSADILGTWRRLKWWISVLELRPVWVLCKLFLSPHRYPSFLNFWKTFMQPKEPFEYHVSILYLGSEINDLISWTVGSHSTVCRFAARSQELSSFLSEWRDEAQREGQSGHCFRCWHLLASFMQRHTSGIPCVWCQMTETWESIAFTVV